MMKPLFRAKILRSAVRILLSLVLLAAVGFGAVKGYYWYQVRSVVDEFRQQLSLFANLEYGAIETGFDGVAGVRDLVVTPLGQSQGVTIDAVRLKTGGMMELMLLKRDFDKGQPPQQLGFEIEGLAVDLAGPVFKQWLAQAAAQSPQSVDWMPGCEAALKGFSDLELMQRLGYQTLRMNLLANYRFDHSSKLLHLKVQQSLDQLFGVEFSVTVDLGINEFNRQNLALARPSLGAVVLHYQDRSYNKRLVRFCAEATGETEQQFIDRHVALEFEGFARLGLVLPDSLARAYRDFLSGDGDVRLRLLDERQLGLTDLTLNSPEQLVQLLAPKLMVNGKPVEPLTIGWQPADEAAQSLHSQIRNRVEVLTTLLQTPFVEPDLESESEPPVAAMLQSAPPDYGQQQSYRVTAVNRLQPYVGSHIRIATKNGNLVEGRLLSIERKELRIYQEVGFGDAILPIAFKHIDVVMAYR